MVVADGYPRVNICHATVAEDERRRRRRRPDGLDVWRTWAERESGRARARWSASVDNVSLRQSASQSAPRALCAACEVFLPSVVVVVGGGGGEGGRDDDAVARSLESRACLSAWRASASRQRRSREGGHTHALGGGGGDGVLPSLCSTSEVKERVGRKRRYVGFLEEGSQSYLLH